MAQNIKKFLTDRRRNSVALLGILVLSLTHLLPYLFIGNINAQLYGNQLKILVIFIGALGLFFIQRGKLSNYNMTIFLGLYLFSGFLLYLNSSKSHFFRALSLSYILLAYVSFVIFQYKSHLNQKKIKSIFSYLQVLFFLSVIFRYLLIGDSTFYIRPHGLIILYIILEVTGIRLGRLNVLILLIGTLVMSYLSYNSRIAQIVVGLLLINDFGLKRVLFFFIPFLLILSLNSDLFVRFSDNGLEDFGRAYIYDCILTNFDKINYLSPTYSGLENCYDFEYLHSSFLILLVEYGSISGIVLIVLSIFVCAFKLVKKIHDFPGFWIFIAIFLFSAVEGGMEWFYLYILGLLLFKLRALIFHRI